MTRIPQAGAIVFRADGPVPRILLVRAKQSPDLWIFPKGHIEPGESHAAAALREADEEAGVRGTVVGLAGPALHFESGTENVRVEYYIVSLTEETHSPEGRETRWFLPADVHVHLAHDDARQLFRNALPEIERRAHTCVGIHDDDRFAEFLKAEYEHLGESLLRNEESGEKRVTFFLTLCGAMGALLGFVLDDRRLAGFPERLFVVTVLIVLIVLGYATFVRVVTRNAASDRYKNRLARIRRFYVQGERDPRVAALAFNPFDPIPRHRASPLSLGRGGWLETTALTVGLLSGALCAFLLWWSYEVKFAADAVRPAGLLLAMALGTLAGWAAWCGLIARGNALYGRENPEKGRDHNL